MIRDCPQKSEEIGASVILHDENRRVDQKIFGPMQKYRNRTADELSELLNVSITKGRVNGEDVLVMRDSGFGFAAVSARYVKPEQYIDEYETVLLMDCTPRRFQKAKIEVETDYFTGELVVFVVENPVVDLVFGNVNTVEKDMKEEITEAMEAGDKAERIDVEKSVPVASVVTRAQEIKQHKPKLPLIVPSPELVDRETFREFQQDDPKLRKYWEMVTEEPRVIKGGQISFEEKNGLLYRKFEPVGKRTITKQLMVPQKLTRKVISVAHDGLLSGHCGIKRTLERVLSNFHWKDVSEDVRRYCKSCDICQKTVQKGRQGKAPLQKMPVIKEPFKRVAVDLVGPITPVSDRGHRYILTVVDYATRYPEAEVLKNIDTISVAEALVNIFCRVGFPDEMLTDQGTQFMSDIMKEVNRLLSIQQLRTTPWHPMCNGLVERFNGTLKMILKRMCAERPKEWDRYLPAVLFAYRSSIQDSVGFSPFELLFGRKVRGPMEILKAYWAKEEQDEDAKTVYRYVVDLKSRLEDTCKLAHEELLKAQEIQKKMYDRTARPKKLDVGAKALLLLPTKTNKLLLQWKGPYEIVERLSAVNYKIQIGKKQKIYHVNMLRPYSERDKDEIEKRNQKIDERKIASTKAASLVLKDGIGDEADNMELIDVCPLKATQSWKDVTISTGLLESQRKEIMKLLEEQKDVLSTIPGHTKIEKHTITTTTTEPIRDKMYPLPYSQRQVMRKEVEEMLTMKVIRKSKSPYAAPPVLVKKPDGSVRFCVNYKKLNSVTVFDGEPMPNPDDVYIQMRGKLYRSKLDLTKGYWQIEMDADSIEKTAFITPDGVYEFLKLPFGLKNSAASFNRLMRIVLGDLDGVGCFIDDICIFTNTWAEHIELLRKVFGRLRDAGLTVKPSKCSIGYSTVEFVGHRVQFDSLHPRTEKIEEILELQRPKSKKEIKSFLAMTGYYAKFIPRFADMVYPLTELTKRNKPFKWDETEEKAFADVRRCLRKEPILKIVDFGRQMYVQTDASDVGLGGALLQKYGNIYHPIKFISRKLKKAEKNYSTIEKEGLAIVWAVEKFVVYLYGREFILLTDHRPLTFIQLSKMHNSRVMRWSMFLQDWCFHVESIKGVDNVLADYLSRTCVN